MRGSGTRSEHEFVGEVCDALPGIKSVLILGSHTAQGDLRLYCKKHRPNLATQIVGWETVDHTTEGGLVKKARELFVKRVELVATSQMT